MLTTAKLTILHRLFPAFQALGVHVTPVHFYQPIPDTRALPESLWVERDCCIDFRETAQLELLDTILTYKTEIDGMPLTATDNPQQYFIYNGCFESVDGEILYGMVRHFRPKKVIEIGSGYSTLLTAQALRINGRGRLHAIEPYPSADIRIVPDTLTEKPVQTVPLGEFASLGPNDILFIDSSHVATVGSDVVFEFCEILPRLAPGVLVHIHDIFLPLEYKRSQIMTARMFWNEQYLLHAMLANNPAWRVVWGGAFMNLKHPDKLQAFRSYRPTVQPGSIWIQKRY